MIHIYPSLLDGEPIESHKIDRRQTVAGWLGDNVEGFELERDYHPIAVEIEGEYIPVSEWESRYITGQTSVSIRVMPQRSVVSSIGSAIGSVINAVVDVVSSLFSFLSPSIPGTRTETGEQGSSIYNPNAQANTPRLGGVIPEIAGRHKVFPDYLSQARRYFSGPRIQALDLMLCVGVGEYERELDELRIGATPVGRLGSTVDYQFFEPGQSVTSHPAHRNWYTAPEVGASTGASGIRLLSERDIGQSWPGTLVFSGSTITGTNTPEGWSDDLDLEVSIPLDVVVSGASGGYQTFTGHFKWLGLSVGAEMYVRMPGSDNTTRHRVASYVEGAPGATDDIEIEAETFSGGWTPIGGAPTGNQVFEFQRRSPGGGPAPFRILDLEGDIATVELIVDGSPLPGWVGWDADITTNEARVVLASTVDGGIWSNVFLACPPDETTTLIEWDILLPQGLGRVNDDGNIESRTRNIEIQWRPAGTESWTTTSRAIEAATRDQLGYTFEVGLPSAITPEVRVRRVESEDNDTRSMDRIEWLRLKSLLEPATSYPGATTLAMTVQGSNAISNQSENKISCVVTRKLAGTPTRSIADWFRYVALDSGWDASELNQSELDWLDGLWSSRGDTFDFVQDSEGTTKEVLRRCLRAGMAELTVSDGLLTPVRDAPRSTFEHMYTPQNMLGDGLRRQASLVRPDEIDGVDVEYFDGESWTNETVECRLPGDDGVRAEKIRIEGVTSRTQAWRIGMRERRQLRYRRWSYQFSTELDALNSGYMSYCALVDDVPGYGQSALVKSVSGSTLELTEPVPDDATLLAWRRPDGTLSGPWTITQTNGFYATVDASELPSVNWSQELPHVVFGTTERWSFPVLITSIQPRGFDQVQVQAANYDERIYADDNNSPS